MDATTRLLDKKKDIARNFHEKRVVVDLKTVHRALDLHEQAIRQEYTSKKTM